jgi:hypothetical protein
MNQGQQYWTPYLETLPREDLHRLQLKKFKRIFQWAYTHSKSHHRLYEKAGVTPADITTLNDIRRVPKVEKSMMRDIKEERATAMMGAPTYILGMAETAKSRLQLPSWQSCGKDYK